MSTEYGVTYVTEAGDLHTEWGYTVIPDVALDGTVNVGKREWCKAYEIRSRPVCEETSVWKSQDCPW